MPVEAWPQPSLILVRAQQALGFFVILLHPMPTMRVRHHLAPVPPSDRRRSSSTVACRRRHPHRSATPNDDVPTWSRASHARRETVRASSRGGLPARSPSAMTAPPGPPPGHQPVASARRAATGPRRSRRGRRPRSACDASPGHPGSWGCRRSRRPRSHRQSARPNPQRGREDPGRSAAWSGRRPPRGPSPSCDGRCRGPRTRASRVGWRPARRRCARRSGS